MWCARMGGGGVPCSQEYLYIGKLTRKGIEGSDPVSYFLSSFTPCDACATSGLRVVEKPRMRF
eukprot:m.45163 g.45163  ORF g.45163 m.45163 type:complete len:63 (-) comp8609_c0_seq1:162-350(-)